MSKHTPGPWEVHEIDDDWGIDPDNPEVISRGVRQVGGRSINQGVDLEMFSEADARLIAAAPDLLAACEFFADSWGRADVYDGHEAVGRIRAAIARARGESS